MIRLLRMNNATSKLGHPAPENLVANLARLGLMLALFFIFGCSSATSHAPGSTSTKEILAPGSGTAKGFDAEKLLTDPLLSKDAKATVLIFVRTDCPISNRYAPEIQRLYQKYKALGIVFWLVYPDPDTTAASITSHLKDYGLSLRPLRDPHHALVKRARVSVTPEVAVFLPTRQEVYHGRIDDRFVDFGKERASPTRHDLDATLDSILRGKSIANYSTIAVGCYISDIP
jgi:hypothetical protein